MLRKGFVRWGILLGVITVGVRLLSDSDWIERYYSRGFFPILRTVWDHLLTSWMPIPLVYLLLLWLVYTLVKNVLRWRKRRGFSRVTSFFWGLLGLVGWGVGTFLLCWGFNYGRVSVAQKLGLSPSPLDTLYLKQTTQEEAAALVQLRQSIPHVDTTALGAQHFPAQTEDLLRQALEATLVHYNYPAIGQVRGRTLWPKGIFLYFGSAGLYLPWTGEGHIDAGLLPLQVPYTLTHELAHGYGFADEGTCSFWAYLAAFKVSDPALEYAIRLGYWRSLAAHWKRLNPTEYQSFRDGLPAGLQADLAAINTNLDRYPDVFPFLQDVLYDRYLKTQGIQEGLANYSTVVTLVEAWRQAGGQGYIRL
ncbi:MAG: DUF3810 family protein [Saprospiraceae bacterium]